MITSEQVEAALQDAEPGVVYPREEIVVLAERANKELRAWGHAGHRVAVERVTPFFGSPSVLRWVFWCQNCHVSQVALLENPPVEQTERGDDHWVERAGRGPRRVLDPP